MLLSFAEYSPWSEAFQITLQPPHVYSFKSELYEKHNIIHSRRFLNQDAFQMECSVCVRLSNLSKWFKNFTLRDHLSRNRFWLAAARPPWLNSGFSAAGTTRAPLNWTMATGRSLLNAAGQVFPSVLTLTFRLKVYESHLSLLWALPPAREEMMVSESPSLKCLAHHRLLKCHSSGSKDMCASALVSQLAWVGHPGPVRLTQSLFPLSTFISSQAQAPSLLLGKVHSRGLLESFHCGSDKFQAKGVAERLAGSEETSSVQTPWGVRSKRVLSQNTRNILEGAGEVKKIFRAFAFPLKAVTQIHFLTEV